MKSMIARLRYDFRSAGAVMLFLLVLMAAPYI